MCSQRFGQVIMANNANSEYNQDMPPSHNQTNPRNVEENTLKHRHKKTDTHINMYAIK